MKHRATFWTRLQPLCTATAAPQSEASRIQDRTTSPGLQVEVEFRIGIGIRIKCCNYNYLEPRTKIQSSTVVLNVEFGSRSRSRSMQNRIWPRIIFKLSNLVLFLYFYFQIIDYRLQIIVYTRPRECAILPTRRSNRAHAWASV